MKLIITEKPSTGAVMAHTVGAREKIYGKGNAYCYKGGGYYVVSARGHLYSLGEPEDYGFSKTYKLEELPMFPEFKIFPAGTDTENIRKLISNLINRDDVDEIINACDAGREGELIFRQIYEANHCTKPVKRLWCNSMTDEAIRQQMQSLPPDSDFDGEYKAAFARQKADWIIGMNLSRLYGVLDNYAHHVGRVKTPVLSMIVQRDNEIEIFSKTVTYRLEMPNGALSEKVFENREEAERAIHYANGQMVLVISANKEKKSINRPLLHNLTSLQQEANRIYGYTAKETLNAAQTLYEHKLITYPRTDCCYISDDMRQGVIRTVKCLSGLSGYEERTGKLISQTLNLDERVVNNGRMNGHDHHAIIPEARAEDISGLAETEQNVYRLVANRLLCALDKPYIYEEASCIFECGGIRYKLKKEIPLEMGWKEYDTEKEETQDNSFNENYLQGTSFTAEGIKAKEIVSQPPKHFTDASLLSVMANIDNRIDDNLLKSAVSGKGIGTEATRADVIEELIRVGYAERSNRQIISTKFGRDFIASIPDSVKSLERTAEWEQFFTELKEKDAGTDAFFCDVRNFVNDVILLETDPARHRTPLHYFGSNAPAGEIIGTCPRCGKNIIEGKKNFYCESGKNGCGFTLWKEDKFIKTAVTPETAKKLLKGKAVKMIAVGKDGSEYEADHVLEDTGKYVNLKRIPKEKKVVGKCPRCGKNVCEGKNNFYCESGKDGCGFTLWKDDNYNGFTVTAADVSVLLSGKSIEKVRKFFDGKAEKERYVIEDTGKYVNIRGEEQS